MKKKNVCKLIAMVICACLSAQSVAAGPFEVQAEEVQEEYNGPEVPDTDMPEDDAQGADEVPEAEEIQENVPDSDSEAELGEVQDDRESPVTDPAGRPEDKTEAEAAKAEDGDIATAAVEGPLEAEEEKKISFAEEKEQILIEFKDVKTNKNKVSEEPLDGSFYYTGSNIKPKIQIYTLTEITDEEEFNKIPDENRYESIKEGQEIKRYQKTELLKEKTDYTITYPKTCKALGEYVLTVTAAKKSQKYEGLRKVSYEIIEKDHKWGSWKTTVKQNVFKEGKKQRTCSICKKTQTGKIAKAKATIKFNMKTIPLRVKQTTTKFKVSGLASGDYVKSYKSSNKKIFTVDKKGRIRAKKKGAAKLTVTLASGKKATANVKVQKGTVKTTKVSVNTSKLVLLKGGKYTLKATLAPLTSQQKVTYSSSNKKVATVSSKGVIKAKKKGTAKITVKSGSKKKKITVTVQTPTFPKGNGNAFLKTCQKLANTIMTDGNWIYSCGSGNRDSFAEARGTYRQTNCSNYVSFCMQQAGTLEPGMTFYSSYSAKIVYRGSAAQKAATKKMIEKNYDIINIGGKKAVKAGLQPGDICLYKGHVNVFAGLNDKGVPMWYDAGRNSTSDEKAESGYFTNMYRACYYNSLPVYTVFRLKK